ncbi:MAG TPA: hypothetical protein VHT96_01710 [Clostridia bacterium]|nr:hypothetical protein [Clostridia bacterium]
MRYRNNLSNIVCLAVILSGLLITPGCRKSSQGQNMQLQSAKEKTSQEEQEPKKLKTIETGIESLFETLGGPSAKIETGGKSGGGQGQGSQQKSGQQQGSQQKSGQQQGSQQQSGQQQGSQQGSQQQSGQQQGTKSKKGQSSAAGKKTSQKSKTSTPSNPPEKWAEVDKLVNALHFQWNDFMPEVAKKGADMKFIDSFDTALNNLTTTTASKDKDKVMTSANELYKNIPDLYSIYRTKMSPEVKRLIYYSRNIILESAKDNWEQVKKDNESIEKSWSLFKNTLDKEQQHIADKLNFSIYELKKVTGDKNKQLSGLKGKIVLNNIKELEQSFEKKKS